MSESVKMTFRRVRRSPALEQKIRACADKLREFHGPAIHCELIVEPAEGRRMPAPLHMRLNVYGVRKEISLEKTGFDALGHPDAYVAVRELFDAAERMLERCTVPGDRSRAGADAVAAC